MAIAIANLVITARGILDYRIVANGSNGAE